MGWRFRRSVKLLPGIKVNFGKKSASVTVGGRLARKTYSTTGRQTTSYSVPGTGLYYTTSTGGRTKRSERRSAPPPKPPFYRRTWFIVLMLMLLPPAGIALMWLYRREWRMPVKITVTALSLLWFIALLTPKPAADPQQPASSPMAASTSAPTASPTSSPTAAPTTAPTAAPTSVPAATDVPILQKGDTGEAVRAMQAKLIELGYLTDSADGQYGSGTRSAVKDFQKQNGLTDDGVAGPKTIEMLFSAFAQAKAEPSVQTEKKKETYVWITSGGKCYHSSSSCSNMKNPQKVTKDEAESKGKSRCPKCY